MNPAISIIVPVYNVEKYVEKCLGSIINQTFGDIEIVLVDDGSTDSSGVICDEYAHLDKRIKVIHQKNSGLGISRNSGLEVATGKFVGFIDSDDCISSRMFEVLYNNAVNNNADVSYCCWKKFWTESEISEPDQISGAVVKWSGKTEIRQYMLDRIGLPPQEKNDNFYGASVCCGIFKRSIIDKYSIKFISERKFIAEDILFDMDFIRHCSCIVHVDAPLYFYRYNPKSLTTTYKVDRFEKNVELYHEMCRRLERDYNNDEYFQSMARYFLTFTRVAIIQEILNLKSNGLKSVYIHIKRFCENEELLEILQRYDYRKLPWKYRIFCLFQKRKMPMALILLTYLSCLKRR